MRTFKGIVDHQSGHSDAQIVIPITRMHVIEIEKRNSKILIYVVSLHLVLVHPLSMHFLLRVNVCPL